MTIKRYSKPFKQLYQPVIFDKGCDYIYLRICDTIKECEEIFLKRKKTAGPKKLDREYWIESTINEQGQREKIFSDIQPDPDDIPPMPNIYAAPGFHAKDMPDFG